MEYAKDEIYTIEYNKRKNKKNRTNNLLSLLLSIGAIFSIANVIAIYNFFRILSNI